MGALVASVERGRSAWADAGLTALTGTPDAPPAEPPPGLVEGVRALGRRIETASTALGSPVSHDWLALLGERAALDGLRGRGAQSCGGAARLLRAVDAWVAVSLARPSDWESVPAWLAMSAPTERGREGEQAAGAPGGASARSEAVRRIGDGSAADRRWAPDSARWDAVSAAVETMRSSALVSAAALLGLPVAIVGETRPDVLGGVRVEGVEASFGGRVLDRWGSDGRPAGAAARPLRVLDLSTLWAGPLCGSLLAEGGADVVKVESTRRPDASRQGSPGLFDLLNGAKRSVALDLSSTAGRAALARLVRRADVVVESARPRALEQMGIVAHDELRGDGGPRIWVSLTGHGRGSDRVAFGDDAAAAGGLVVTAPDGTPWFCGDALADPLGGLAAAAAALESLGRTEGAPVLIDVALAGVAASMATPEGEPRTLASPGAPDVSEPPGLPAGRGVREGPGAHAPPPRARPVARAAPALGAHSDDVFAEWCAT